MKMTSLTCKAVSIFAILSLLTSCATIQSMSPTKPQNSDERNILMQAVAAGAAVGAITGMLASEIEELERYKKWLPWLGGAVGGAVGWVIANNQIHRLRDVRLENEQLDKLLDSARQYNNEVEAYNNNLRNQIAELNSRKPKHQEIARQKQAEAKRYQEKVQKMIEERNTLSNTLVTEQKDKYEETLADLKIHEEHLSDTISELEKISGGAVIGS